MARWIVAAFILGWCLVGSARADAQTSSAGLKSVTVALTQDPQTLISLVSPGKFILTDVTVTFRFNSAISNHVDITDAGGTRLQIVPPSIPYTHVQSFTNGLLFTTPLSALCSSCSVNDILLTVSGRSVSK